MSYSDETSHSYTLPNEDQKAIWMDVIHPRSSADISVSPEIPNFCSIKKYKYSLIWT